MADDGVSKKDVISSKESAFIKTECNNHEKWLQYFLQSPFDSYCIYQLIDKDDNSEQLFMSLNYLKMHSLTLNYDDYKVVYSGPLSGGDITLTERLENIFIVFNGVLPEDYTGRSLSVSDVIAIKVSGVISFYYVDSVGFKKVTEICPKFISDIYPTE